MTSDYFSREAAKKELCERCSDFTMCTRSDNDCPITRGLNSLPAADVVEMRHGRWLPSDIPDSILDKCSECGFDTGAFTFRFCPNCGAKMDGGQDDD